MNAPGIDRARLWTVLLPLLAGPLAYDAATWPLVAEHAPQTHTVEMRDFAFHPAPLEASPGDTVVGVERAAVPHTATAESGAWDSGHIAPNGSWKLPVEGKSGARYRCTFHPSMQGTLAVP